MQQAVECKITVREIVWIEVFFFGFRCNVCRLNCGGVRFVPFVR